MSLRNILILGLLAPLYLAGCGHDDHDDHDHDHAGHGDHGATSCDDSATDYVAFMTGISQGTANGAFTVTITGAEPMMPMQGENTWQLTLADGDGVAVSGATVVVTPDMPDHGHGTDPATFTATAGAEEGAYSVGPIPLQMPGVWRFSVQVTPAEGEADTATLNVCAMAASQG